MGGDHGGKLEGLQVSGESCLACIRPSRQATLGGCLWALQGLLGGQGPGDTQQHSSPGSVSSSLGPTSLQRASLRRTFRGLVGAPESKQTQPAPVGSYRDLSRSSGYSKVCLLLCRGQRRPRALCHLCPQLPLGIDD